MIMFLNITAIVRRLVKFILTMTVFTHFGWHPKKWDRLPMK